MKVLNLIWQMIVEIPSLSYNTRLVTTAYALCMVLFFFFGMACYCVFYKDSIFLNFAVLFVLYSNNCEILVHVVVLEVIWPSFAWMHHYTVSPPVFFSYYLWSITVVLFGIPVVVNTNTNVHVKISKPYSVKSGDPDEPAISTFRLSSKGKHQIKNQCHRAIVALYRLPKSPRILIWKTLDYRIILVIYC